MASRTVPETGYVAHMVRDKQPVHFESVGRQFEPGGAKRCLRRSTAWSRPREVPEPTLSSGPVAHLWHIVTDLRHVPGDPAQFRCSLTGLPQMIGTRSLEYGR